MGRKILIILYLALTLAWSGAAIYTFEKGNPKASTGCALLALVFSFMSLAEMMLPEHDYGGLHLRSGEEIRKDDKRRN